MAAASVGWAVDDVDASSDVGAIVSAFTMCGAADSFIVSCEGVVNSEWVIVIVSWSPSVGWVVGCGRWSRLVGWFL